MPLRIFISSYCVSALAICAASSVVAQPIQGADTGVAPTAASANDPASLLSANLRILSQNPYDVEALTQAGLGALAVEDASAAMGFLARAEELSPQSGRIKAALGSALAMLEKPDEALSLFAEAVVLGASAAEYAADRGLAYDLKGENRRAQRDYDLALRYRADDKVILRLALSLGITGDRDAALTLLTPLVKKNNQAAWRARAFVLAMNGQLIEAERIANDATPGAIAGAMSPFLERLSRLSPSQRAHAVHFGTMPSAGVRYAIAETNEPFRPVAFAEPQPPKLDRTVEDTRVLALPLPTPDTREARQREKRERELGKIANRSKALTDTIPSPPIAAKKIPALMPQTQAVIDELLRPKVVVADVKPIVVARPEPATPITSPQEFVLDPVASQEPKPIFEVQPIRKIEIVALPPSGFEARPALSTPEPVGQAPIAGRPPTPVSPPPSRLAALLEGIEVEQETVANALPSDVELKAARAATRKKADVEAKAAAIKAVEAKKLAEEKAVAKKHPARHWVQIATGANRAGLPGTWKKLQGDAPKTLAGQSAASVPFKSTNRLLVGPFKSEAEARALVNKLSKEGKSATAYTSESGQEIAKIGGK